MPLQTFVAFSIPGYFLLASYEEDDIKLRDVPRAATG